MKTQYKQSEAVTAFLTHGRGYQAENLDRLNQACESALNDRQFLSRDSLGMKNRKKESVAESAEEIRYRQQISVVTAFIEWAEAKSGRIDRTLAKAEKLGIVGHVADIPSTFAGQAIGEWVAQFGPEAESKPEGEAKPEAKVPKAKAKRQNKPAEPVEAGQSNGQH